MCRLKTFINPDPFKNAEGKRVDPSFDERFPLVVERIKQLLSEDHFSGDDRPLVAVHHMFYSE
jgi:hypothetical protein